MLDLSHARILGRVMSQQEKQVDLKVWCDYAFSPDDKVFVEKLLFGTPVDSCYCKTERQMCELLMQDRRR